MFELNNKINMLLQNIRMYSKWENDEQIMEVGRDYQSFPSEQFENVPEEPKIPFRGIKKSFGLIVFYFINYFKFKL